MRGISSAGARMRAAQGSADVRCTGVASAYGAPKRTGGDMRTAVKLIAEHTYMLTDRLTGVNQFLLEGKEKALLIDTGYGTKSLPRVVEKLTSLPVMVVNTHLHPDHSNGNGFFGKVMVGEPDLPSHGVPSNYIFEGVASAYRKSLLRPLMSVARKFALIDPSAAEYSPMPDMIHLGERSLDAVPCPGHTAGSVIFCDSETTASNGCSPVPPRGRRTMRSFGKICKRGSPAGPRYGSRTARNRWILTLSGSLSAHWRR